MAPSGGSIDIKLKITSEELLKTIETLAKENEKTMASISANTEQVDEEFSLSELDYDELLETYGDDPVLMTILNRMKEFFRGGPNPEWFKFSEWPGGDSTVDPSKYLRTDPGTLKWDTNTTIDTTSTVSETFTLKYDDHIRNNVLVKDSTTTYTIE